MPRDPRQGLPAVWDGYARRTLRMPGYGGAAVFMRSQVIPARESRGNGTALAFDVGLLSPDRITHYLSRAAGPGFVERLSQFLFRAASDFHPEKSLPTFIDEAMGLTVSAMSSTDARVAIEVTMIEDPGAPVLDPDSIDFETSRAVLVVASHDLRRLGRNGTDGTLGQDLAS